jgi:hypothetical protein
MLLARVGALTGPAAAVRAALLKEARGIGE